MTYIVVNDSSYTQTSNGLEQKIRSVILLNLLLFKWQTRLNIVWSIVSMEEPSVMILLCNNQSEFGIPFLVQMITCLKMHF